MAAWELLLSILVTRGNAVLVFLSASQVSVDPVIVHVPS